jgi:hypothetical protein
VAPEQILPEQVHLLLFLAPSHNLFLDFRFFCLLFVVSLSPESFFLLKRFPTQSSTCRKLYRWLVGVELPLVASRFTFFLTSLFYLGRATVPKSNANDNIAGFWYFHFCFFFSMVSAVKIFFFERGAVQI